MPNESESLLYHLEPFCLPNNEGILLPSVQSVSVILIVCFAALGPLPVLIDRGQVVQDVLDWLNFQKDKGKASSTLYRYALALSRFCDFWKWCQSQAVPQKPILTAFFEDLVHGKRELGWKGIGVDYAKVHIEILGLFLDWFVDVKKLDNHPNPLIEEPQSFGRLLEECSRRYKNDFLFHLMPTTKRATTRKRRKIQPHLRAMRGGAANAARPKKTFLFENFIIVVKFERCIWNLLLWLLMGPGGLRLCEALHLFTSDISLDAETGEARILLADPTYGKIQVPPGNTQKLSRQEYLKEKFGLVPRDQLPLNDLQFIGWKGMKFHHPETKTADVVWLHPFFGQLFWKLHKLYLKSRGDAHPKHPYYFVNLKHNIGEPLTATNAKQLFADLCARLNLRPPHNVHSLRHNRIRSTADESGLIGTDDGFTNLRRARATGLMNITMSGICPGTSCATGLDSKFKTQLGADVPGSRCALCKYHIYGPAFLIGMVMDYNCLLFELELKAHQQTTIRKAALEAEDRGDEGELMRLRGEDDRIDQESTLDLTVLARLGDMIDECVAMSNGDSTVVRKTGLELVTQESIKFGVAVEHVSKFRQLTDLAELAQVIPATRHIAPSLAQDELKDRLLSLLYKNGANPYLAGLSKDASHKASLDLARLLGSLIPEEDLKQDLLDGVLQFRDLPGVEEKVLDHVAKATSELPSSTPSGMSVLEN